MRREKGKKLPHTNTEVQVIVKTLGNYSNCFHLFFFSLRSVSLMEKSIESTFQLRCFSFDLWKCVCFAHFFVCLLFILLSLSLFFSLRIWTRLFYQAIKNTFRCDHHQSEPCCSEWLKQNDLIVLNFINFNFDKNWCRWKNIIGFRLMNKSMTESKITRNKNRNCTLLFVVRNTKGARHIQTKPFQRAKCKQQASAFDLFRECGESAWSANQQYKWNISTIGGTIA